MPGPNSAPNGDRTIIRGDIYEEFYTEKNGNQIPMRQYLSERGRLRTGKTDLKNHKK